MAPPIPPAPPVTSATRPSRLFRGGSRRSLASSSDQVLDVERVLFRDRHVLVDRLSPSNDADGALVELGGDPGDLFVALKRQQPQSWNEHDDRRRITHRRRVRAPAALVVRGVLRTVALDCRGKARDEVGCLLPAGRERHEHRAHPRSQKMIGARRPETRQRLAAGRPDELEHRRRVDVVHHLRAERAEEPPKDRSDRLEQPSAVRRREGGCGDRSERFRFSMRVEPVRRLLDRAERRVITRARARPPGDQAVTAQDEPDRIRPLARDAADRQPEIEAWTLPGHPREVAAKNLLREPLTVSRRCDRDDGVGVHVIDVTMVDEPVQGRVDARGAGVQVERAVRKVRRHLVFALPPRILAGEIPKLVEIERREAVERRAAEVSTRTLDPEHARRLTGQRIQHGNLGGGVAAAVVRNPEIRSEQVGSIPQELLLGQAPRLLLVPEVRQAARGGGRHVLRVGRHGALMLSRRGVSVTGPRRPESSGSHFAAVKRPSAPRFCGRRAGKLTL